MSKRSPGPWRFEDGWVVDVNGNVVSRHMLANGPLIAAAPEMLELLRSLDAEAHTVDEFARRFRAFLERRVALLRRIDGEP